MKKKHKDRADRLWVMIHVTALRLTQEKNKHGTDSHWLKNGGRFLSRPLKCTNGGMVDAIGSNTEQEV